VSFDEIGVISNYILVTNLIKGLIEMPAENNNKKDRLILMGMAQTPNSTAKIPDLQGTINIGLPKYSNILLAIGCQRTWPRCSQVLGPQRFDLILL